MAQYIDKNALVSEVERRIKSTNNDVKIGAIESLTVSKTLNSLISFINTLEVKEEFKIGETQIYLEDDGGEPPYDGKQWLDLSCREYEIPEDKFKDGDNVEIVIRKTQKGK